MRSLIALARIGRSLALLPLAAAWGCRREAPAPPSAPVFEGVLLAKCAEVLRGAVCRVAGDRTVNVFIPGGATEIRILADGRELLSVDTSGSDGRRVAVGVPKGTRDLQVSGRTGGALRIVHRAVDDAPPAPPWLDEVRRAKERGALDDASRLLEAAETTAREAADAGARGVEIASLRARLALSRGDAETAVTLLEKSAAMHAARGEPSRAADDEAARAHVLIGDLRRAAEAKETIARLASFANEYPEAGAYAAYYEGALAGDAGDLGTSLARFADARAQAERLGVAKITRSALQGSSNVLLAVGRAEEAHDGLAKLDATEGDAMSVCERATLRLNIGWAAILVGDAPDAPSARNADALTPLRLAVEAFAGPCANPRLHGSALDNLAWAELQHGDVAAARKALVAARALSPHPKPLVAFGELQTEGRIALAEGDAKGALRVYEALAARAAGVSRLDEEVAEEGRANALAKLGDRAGALAAATRAEALVDESARAIPAGEGRGAFFWARARLTRTKVALLLDAGRAGDALDAARTGRARLHRDMQRAARVGALSPDARARWESGLGEYRSARDAIVAEASDDWSLTGEALARRVVSRRARDVAARARLDALASATFPMPTRELRPLADGEGVVGLACVPLGDDTWATFVVEGGKVHGTRVSAPTDPSRARGGVVLPRLLAPALPALLRARRLRVLAADLDVGAFVVAGESLLARMPIAYTLDVADPPHGAGLAHVPAALVVGDPTGALPAARREAVAVAERLGAATLLLGADATRARVLDALGRATSMHFAGHASYGGVDGWDSALYLAHGERLSVADVLALDHAPSRVVLSGCETGRDGEHGGLGPVGVGLADAFIAAGAHAVVASTRPVSDATTEPLMRALADALDATPDDVPLALRHAQLEVGRTLSSGDERAFRAFVP